MERWTSSASRHMLRMNAVSVFVVADVCGGGGIGGVSCRGAMALMLIGLVMISRSGSIRSSVRLSTDTSEKVAVGGSLTRTSEEGILVQNGLPDFPPLVLFHG